MTERVRVKPCEKLVRAIFGGEVVASSSRTLLVWEKPYFPTYYFPPADVNTDLLVPASESAQRPGLGTAQLFTVKADGREAAGAAYSYPDSPVEEIRGHIAFVWRTMDHWFEEDEEVYVHPRDPYSRVDTLTSSRRVRVEVDGVTVADTSRPTLLFETGLPARYYVPKMDVRLDLLEPSDHTTECPYKGTAEYWTLQLESGRHENLVWSYPFPTLESVKIAGLMCFYNEKVDLYVDDELQDRPATPFS